MRQLISSKPGMQSLLKVALIVAMLLLFLIPLSMVRSVVDERSSLALAAADRIVDGSGGSFVFVGPLFAVPYHTVEADEKGIPRRSEGELLVLPDSLRAEGTLQSQYRSRGIYEIPVYTAEFAISGQFSMPQAEAFPDGAVVRPSGLRVIAGIRDMRGILKAEPLNWNGRQYAVGPDLGVPALGSGITAGPLDFRAADSPAEFSLSLAVSGGRLMSIAPLGRDSELALAGTWPSPSFRGARLPDERSWDESGFDALWRVPEVSRPIRPYWVSGDPSVEPLVEHALTVELLKPVSTYTRTHRSVKYGVLFLLIPFIVFFLFEIFGGTRIHPIQYLLAGAADIVFYLLLLAISEHWGFDWAYLTASAAVTLLLGFYAWGIVARKYSGLVMPLVLAGGYLWLWVSLQSEDYALLIGAIGLFVILAVVMICTRRINWYDRGSIVDETNFGAEGKDDR